MSQHTPGPWITTIHHDREAVATKDCFQVIADCGLQEEAEANARLIAAAPEFLEWANRAISSLESYDAAGAIPYAADPCELRRIIVKVYGEDDG